MAALRLPADDRPFARRLARYCARNPVALELALELALERLTYEAGAKQVTYRSDKAEGPTAGPETADRLEFLARVLTHIPDEGQVTTRNYGWYATRRTGSGDRAGQNRLDRRYAGSTFINPNSAGGAPSRTRQGRRGR